jgi:hypothetical protein
MIDIIDTTLNDLPNHYKGWVAVKFVGGVDDDDGRTEFACSCRDDDAFVSAQYFSFGRERSHIDLVKDHCYVFYVTDDHMRWLIHQAYDVTDKKWILRDDDN